MTKQERKVFISELWKANHAEVNIIPVIDGILEILSDMNSPTRTTFTPPNPLEVTTYTNGDVNGDDFCDFYESKGWMIGKTKMKSWKAATRTWQRRELKENGYKPLMPRKRCKNCSKMGADITVGQYSYEYCRDCRPKTFMERYPKDPWTIKQTNR